jgi:uncharacterized protein YndB with AHSA1/START domain
MATTTRPGVTTYTTPTDREIVITRVVDAPRRLVFAAWTDPKHIPNWLGFETWTMPVCEVDLRPGGAWRYGWRNPDDGTEMTMGGLVREVTPPERLVTTERWGPEWPETVNTLTLTESGGRTTVTLTITYPSKAARDAALETGMKDGMDVSFARLDRLVRTLE